MKFFGKKNSDSRRSGGVSAKYSAPSRRRNTRLWLLQMRKFALLGGVVALIGGAGFSAWHNDSFKKVSNWVSAEALQRSANMGFKVKDILVTGRKSIPAEELLAALTLKQGMPMFSVSITDAQKSLTSISWVKDVVISRRLPDTIVVSLQERAPVALWQHQGKIFLIDQEGVVLTAGNLDAWQHLPLVVGEGAQKDVTQMLGLMQAEPTIAKELVSAVRVDQRRWDLHLKNDITVKLPEQDMELALRHLALLEETHNILGRNIASIDLRQPERVMITPLNTKT